MILLTCKSFGARLKAARERAGVSPSALAERVAADTGFWPLANWIARIEEPGLLADELRVPVHVLPVISRMLGCSLLYLLGVEDG
jgi:transcriptional regulator with XRE-family HTH domain